MFDIMLIREFGVEEINAQNVAKAFVEGARMTGIMDERNVIADIDQLAAQQGPRRELASGEMPLNLFKGSDNTKTTADSTSTPVVNADSPDIAQPADEDLDSEFDTNASPSKSSVRPFVPGAPINRATEPETDDSDPISALFGLHQSPQTPSASPAPTKSAETAPEVYNKSSSNTLSTPPPRATPPSPVKPAPTVAASPPVSMINSSGAPSFMIHISGPGLDTQLHIQDTDDLEIVRILLDKIRKQLS
ncbi:hypothetical protein [Hymenobacter sp. YC55]|uniref:hypothetical protein n=1 Tax=Hymenobacter sp. YC55 TaxID=3034019 RepID=UPI0023F71F7A|nr:hypothetical protein [Hymenobacter sp. YC55]MDF7811548.1 hypothetical protein [Hymenobacter sp. YC55]